MDLLKKLLPVVLVLAVVGGVFLWCLNVDDIKLETEEIPLGLEWGMTLEEVDSTLVNAGCYKSSDDMFYYGHGYQGIVGADYWVWFWLEEEGRLSGVTLYFSSQETSKSYAPVVSEEFLDEFSNSVHKTYSRACEIKCIHDDWASKYYLFENTMVDTCWTLDGKMFALSFKDRDAECNQELIKDVIENAN